MRGETVLITVWDDGTYSVRDSRRDTYETNRKTLKAALKEAERRALRLRKEGI